MLAILLIGSIALPKLAVIARFYHPYPDQRISYQRLYVLDWSGRNQKVVSLPGQECESVMWAGPDRLVYAVTHPGMRFKTSIWTVDLRKGKPRLLLGDGSLDKDAAFESALDGVAVISTSKKSYVTVDSIFGKVMPLKLRANGWYDPFKGPDRAFVPNSIRSRDPAHPGSFTVDAESKASLETPKGRTTMDIQIWYGIHEPQSNRLWALDYPSMHSQRLHRVRWDTGKIQELFWAGYAFDWRPDRKYVAFATQRDLSPYGPKKTVWTNELWVGELETGAQRKLKLPMAWYADVAVRPAN